MHKSNTEQNLKKKQTNVHDNNRLDETVENVPEHYECAICMNWMKDPVQTLCGHRFCKSCLTKWLGTHTQNCPSCQTTLSEVAVFPDNHTRREIEQMRIKCSNSRAGCTIIASPKEIDHHLPKCPFRPMDEAKEKCPFTSVKCDFVSRPETNALEVHLKDDMPHHLQLMLQAFQNTALASWNPQKSNDCAVPPPQQYANKAAEQLIEAMYQRIVVLEQRSREQDVQLEILNKQLAMHQVDPRYSNGTIVWKIFNFEALVQRLRANANNQEYSPECYTSAHGYRFCARINIPRSRNNLISLHVHLMQSENDFHLEWPFKGRIKLFMIHPNDPNQSQLDTIMTKPEILAFHRPQERISTRGFGFVEYVNIAEIASRGFCQNDCLVIKIQINIV